VVAVHHQMNKILVTFKPSSTSIEPYAIAYFDRMSTDGNIYRIEANRPCLVPVPEFHTNLCFYGVGEYHTQYGQVRFPT